MNMKIMQKVDFNARFKSVVLTANKVLFFRKVEDI